LTNKRDKTLLTATNVPLVIVVVVVVVNSEVSEAVYVCLVVVVYTNCCRCRIFVTIITN